MNFKIDPMKKFSLNFGIVIISFAIGLAINSACADSLGDGIGNVDNLDLSELKTIVADLQKEVKTLKLDLKATDKSLSSLQNEVSLLKTSNESLIQRITALEQSNSSNSNNESISACPMFQVDGLWYDPSGFVASPVKSSTGYSRYVATTGIVQENSILLTESVEYDSYGRVTQVNYSIKDYDYYRTKFVYNGKTVTCICEYKHLSGEYVSQEDKIYY